MVKINFFDVLDKYEYCNMTCVKLVLGEFSSGVSVCSNKDTQSDLGTPLFPRPPRPGGAGVLPPALYIWPFV